MSEPTTPQELGRRLMEARKAMGFTMEDVIVQLALKNLPKQMSMSKGKIGHLEKGYYEKPDPFDIEVLAAIYKKKVEELSPEAAEALERYRNFLVIEGGGSPGSPWTPDFEPAAA